MDQQVALLQTRGMSGDPATMRRRLETVNYYRLSGYWYPFREEGRENFRAGTHFDAVWARYVFDRELRLLAMDAVERFEVAVRARMAYEHAMVGGPFGYLQGPRAVWAQDRNRAEAFRVALGRALRQAEKEMFVLHFNDTYGDQHEFPPVWMAVEVMSFGDLVSMFRGSPTALCKAVARWFGVADVVFESWLLSLNVIRNLCAHHSRLWNRKLGVQPKLPRHDVRWHAPVPVKQDRVFAVLTILAELMLQIAPGSRWPHRVRRRIEEESSIDVAEMGFPHDWTENGVWRAAWAAAEPPRS